MEADNTQNPGKPTAMAGSCTSGGENNHLVSADVLRPHHRPPSPFGCREVALNAKRHSDLLAKLGRLTTDQLSTALRAVAEVEKQKKLEKKNNNNRPCNTERHHKNSNVTNASAGRQLTHPPGLQPCLRADAPPWSPDDDVSIFTLKLRVSRLIKKPRCA